MLPLNPIEQTLKNICDANPEIYKVHYLKDENFNEIARRIGLNLKEI